MVHDAHELQNTSVQSGKSLVKQLFKGKRDTEQYTAAREESKSYSRVYKQEVKHQKQFNKGLVEIPGLVGLACCARRR